MRRDMSDSYRDRLRAFVASSQSEMIVNADEHYDRQQPGKNAGGRAAFKLQSGLVVKEFLAIWELFDHRHEFEECVQKLAERIHEIGQRQPFSMIVSCTQTTKELVNHL